MRSSDKLRFSPRDLTVAAAVILLSLLCWLPLGTQASDGALTATVSTSGLELDRIQLNTLSGQVVRDYSLNGQTLTVQFSPEGTAVISSTCPTQDCVHTGNIHTAGQSIVCLPARFSIRLTGSGGVDAVVG